MITIEDIAKQAGVSHSTVSRALADSPLVNASTKERIRQLAMDSGYQVNAIARSLVTRSTSTLGLVVPEVINPYFPKLIHLLVCEAREAGYSALLNLSGAEADQEANCLRSLAERRVDGIILVTGVNGLAAREQLRSLIVQNVPLVLLGWIEGVNDVDLVTGNDASGSYDMTCHLLSLGHRRIVMIGHREQRGPYDRIRGFRRAMAEHGIPIDDALFLGVSTEAQMKDALAELLRRPAPPTAVFAYNDIQALWALKRLSEAGVRVPDDIAVVGFDNLDVTNYTRPSLTTVDFPVEAFAAESVRLLVNRIKGDHLGPEPQRSIVTPRLVVRESSGRKLPD